ncbi:hypothetical protein PINS_up018201 [Pythium insidiosum]|nr:hypothetical protein PINS_up018201 [Pythium insidiosum]
MAFLSFSSVSSTLYHHSPRPYPGIWKRASLGSWNSTSAATIAVGRRKVNLASPSAVVKWRLHRICRCRETSTFSDGSDIALPDLPAYQRVVQRVAAVVTAPSDNATCPTQWSTLHAPRSGVVLCSKFTLLESARVTKDYIVDLSVTYERSYNDTVPGWTTLPASIHECRNDSHEQPYRGVYLHVRRPIAPITNLTGLKDVPVHRAALDDCETSLGVGWQSVMPDLWNLSQPTKEIAGEAKDKTPLVCVSRVHQNVSKVITSVELLNATGHALLRRLATTCRRTFVNDLLLRVLNDPTLAVKDISALRSSHFEWLTPDNASLATATPEAVNNALYRSGRWHWWQRRVTTVQINSSSLDPEDERSIQNQSRLRAVVQKNDTLRFRILQFAGLHFKGNASYPCMNTPE